MESKDLVRFMHMLDSTEAIFSFAQGKKRADLDKDRQFLSAVLRELGILGEAANSITDKTKRRFPMIPWKEIVRMRNRLIHAYFDVSHDVVWSTICDYLPSFHQQIQQIVQSLKSGN